MKKTVIASLIMAASATCHAGELSKHETWVYVPVESFNWREYDAGSKILEEDGVRFGLGVDYRYRSMAGKMPLRFRGEFLYGDVDYDGHTMTGIPVDTNVKYFNWKAEGDAAWRFWFDKVVVDPMLGFGYRAWSRDIKDAGGIDPDTGYSFTSLGYKEKWSMIYGYAGLRLETNRWKNDKWGFFGEASAKIPISVTNKVSEYDVKVHPHKEITPYVELGGWYDKIRLSAYYERTEFGRSPYSSGGAYQPKSVSDVFGAKVGIRF
jgi:hypothetical protein